MSDYGVTDKGFVVKRLDTIMDEVHDDLTSGFGIDTRLYKPSFLNTLITTFCGQIATLWEVAQDSYYAKFPATATGTNLDNAVQYGGIRRAEAKQTAYYLHCTGDDGTTVSKGTTVATSTNPEVRLECAETFTITRDSFNKVGIRIATAEAGLYSVSINGNAYTYTSTSTDEDTILAGIMAAITDEGYTITLSDGSILIEDKTLSSNDVLVLSDNLTTSSVTVIAKFMTEEYGKITLPDGVVTKMVDNLAGFTAVTNMLQPTYGRKRETDIDLRHSYIDKLAQRSSTMLGSIVGELLENVEGVEAAAGFENDTDQTNDMGMPPHSIEVIVEGGDDYDVASAILLKKAGGIQAYGNIKVAIKTDYGDSITVGFTRPTPVYVWIKVALTGTDIASDYATLVTDSILSDAESLSAGDNLYIQKLINGIYEDVSGVTYVSIQVGTSESETEEPASYSEQNVEIGARQAISIAAERIEVTAT